MPKRVHIHPKAPDLPTSGDSSLDARIAALAARGWITAPQGRLKPKIRRVKIAGPPLSEEIIKDRR